MGYNEQVLQYFAERVHARTPKAVCEVETALGLKPKTLWPYLDAMAKDRTCPVYRAPATFEGREYKGFACEAQPIPADQPDEVPIQESLDRVLHLDLQADEGRTLERRHLVRERDPKLRNAKIDEARRTTGRVACTACGFDFSHTYGDHGLDYIECHHRVPLHASGETTTKLADLVLLCSNCHSMIHRRTPWLTFEQLCDLLATNT
jgi:5-methylcytosine-specific restriction endonuclease McrA